MKTLDKMFAPASLAIIGASRREGTLGRMFFDAVLQMNYKGKIFPVNPKAEEIEGITCYPDIHHLPHKPDLAVVLIPKDYVLGTVEDLGKSGVEHIVVISAGFREIGAEGEELENRLLDIVHQYDMRMIGPNSMGLFNTSSKVSLNATFSPTPPAAGHVAFISQSGALGVGILELSKRIGLGFSIFASTGNKTDVGDFDILEYTGRDENTRVITLYQESLDDPHRFRELCSKISREKPILTLKAGRTESGLKAAASHTGALASNDVIADAFLRQCGVLRCETLDELLDTALALSLQPLPRGNRVAVITNAGGPGILASDALEHCGLQLAVLEQKTTSELKKFLPPEAGLGNPVDMIASADHTTYQKACSLVYQDPNVDALLVVIVKPPVNTTPRNILKNLGEVVKDNSRPVYICIMADDDEDSGMDLSRELSLPVFNFPEAAANALGRAFEYTQLKNKKNEKVSLGRTDLSGGTAKEQASFTEIAKRLQRFELDVSPYLVTDNPGEAHTFFQEHGTVALKIANESVIHKSDLGLVKLGLGLEAAISASFREIQEGAVPVLDKDDPLRILVQKMQSGGPELVLGCTTDPVFGKVIMFGIGGIFIELYRDVSFRVLPLRHADIGDMINELQGRKILHGFRNYPAVDIEILSQSIYQFGRMAAHYSDIIEMDLNPLIWSPQLKRPVVVDCRMTLSK